MPPRYVLIDKKDFDEFVKPKRFVEVYEPGVMEVVYDRIAKHGQARIRIFSTIAIHGGDGRKVGGDSIKVVLQVKRNDKWEGAGKKFKRVHRTKNWKDNLLERIKAAAESVNKNTCPICGAALIKKEDNNWCFFGCAMWPVTGCKGSAKCTE
jgi:hypothetical protein